MKKAIIILSALALLGCKPTSMNNSAVNQQEKIIQITYSNAGGDMGYSEILNITADSVNYSYLIAAYNNEEGQYDTVTSNKLWSQLLTSCDLTTFAKIKSGESDQPADGLDQIFTILTTTRTLSFMNGQGDDYEKIKDFLNVVQKLAYECNNKCKQ